MLQILQNKVRYSGKIDGLQKSESIFRQSRTYHLYPLKNEERILKVGGRLVATDCLVDTENFDPFCPTKIISRS